MLLFRVTLGHAYFNPLDMTSIFSHFLHPVFSGCVPRNTPLKSYCEKECLAQLCLANVAYHFPSWRSTMYTHTLNLWGILLQKYDKKINIWFFCVCDSTCYNPVEETLERPLSQWMSVVWGTAQHPQYLENSSPWSWWDSWWEAEPTSHYRNRHHQIPVCPASL